MAIRLVVTAGFGNGTFLGTIGNVVTRGYASSTLATAPRLVITAGFGNGVFNGTIRRVVTRGYRIAAADEGAVPIPAFIAQRRRRQQI